MEYFIFLCSGRSIAFVVNSEHNSHIFLMFPIFTLSKKMLAGYLKKSQ